MGRWNVYSNDGTVIRCEVRNLEYSGTFMGACSLNVTLYSRTPVDFEIGDYIEYRGERFEMNYDPSVVKQAYSGSCDDGFVYENVIFNSLSDELTRCDFLDVVAADNGIHYTSLPSFSFFAESISDLAERIQANLDRVYTGEKQWTVSVSSSYEDTTNVNIQVSNNTVWDALAFVNSKFGTNFVIRGRTIIIGTAGVAIDKLFAYGRGNGLYKIERSAESNQKIITRLRAFGSTRNMPTDYYHNIEGGNVPNNMAVKNLMLPSFPTETHDPYIDSERISELGVREGTVFFDGSGDLEEIYPTMEGMTAEDLAESGIYVDAEGTLDVIVSAEQIEDDGKFEPDDGEDEVTIPDFTITLKDIGFDINDYLSTSTATISMKDGMCGGREFEIVKCEKSDNNYVLTCHRAYDDSLDLYFPYNSYQIGSGDKFVLLNIEMPDVYIQAASQRLLVAAKAYLAKNDYVKYSYVLTVDNIFMARQHDEAVAEGGTSIHDTIKEGDLMRFKDEDFGVHEAIIIDTLTIKENAEESIIPEYSVTLSNEKVVSTIEKIQNQIDILASGGYGNGNVDMDALQTIIESMIGDMYLRKDKPDATPYTLGVGAIDFKGKPINRFIRYYDENKPEEATDADIYSALMVDQKFKEDLKELDDRYLRKDAEDTAHKHITFEEGITVYELAKMMNLEVDKLATIARAIVTQIGSATFVDGFFGEGWQIWKAIATGDWNFTIDRLTVRKVMTVYELIIQKIRSVGGMVVVSAGNGKVKEVEQIELEYKFTFEDGNTFQEHDLMRCQVWTGDNAKYYWVEVVRVEGQNVYTRVADHEGIAPEAGDEVVLMGNTENSLRQGLVLISAAEDGQPRVDVLDGVKTTNFDDCLKARMGALDGISDSRFPSDMQPKGYGLYGNNCYLSGVFVLSNGKDVQTQFAIMEGMIRSSMSSVQQQINAEGNYLSNASMTANLASWEYNNDIKVFRTSGGLLHFNGNFYSIKNAVAGIVPNGDKNVLRLKNSYLIQRNDNFAMHPEFDLVEQMTTDEEGNEVGTGVELYRPRMFYVSFRCLVTTRGTLRVYFDGEETRDDFESYTKIDDTQVLESGSDFKLVEIAGKWNGTGDFYLSFDGDMLMYDLALADNALADMEERWSMQLEITEKKIQANAEHIIQQGEDLEAYRSEFLYTAEQLQTSFSAEIKNVEEDITNSYTSLVKQTAESLTSDYNAKFGDYYGEITEEYTSKIEQTAQDITTSLTAKIDATNDAVGDLEKGLKADYEAKISASAQSLTSTYQAEITDLKNGDIANMKTDISQNASNIGLKASQESVDSLTGRVTTAEAKFELYVSKDDIGNPYSGITIAADLVDLYGKVTFSDFSDGAVSSITDIASSEASDYTSALEQALGVYALSDKTIIEGGYIKTSLINANAIYLPKDNVDGLGYLAGRSSVSIDDLDGTIITNNLIRADKIDVDSLVAKHLQTNSDSSGYKIDIRDGMIWMKDNDDKVVVQINADGYVPAIWLTDSYGNKCGMTSHGIYHNLYQGSYISIENDCLTLGEGARIKGLAIGSFQTGYMNGYVDFCVMSSSTTLPLSTSFPGKIIFVKCNGEITFTAKSPDKIVPWGSYEQVSSVKGNNSSLFFISDGDGLWYGFICH